jgi:hypothetical protein
MNKKKDKLKEKEMYQLYRAYYLLEYNDLVIITKKTLSAKDGRKLTVKLRDYISEVSEKYDSFTRKRLSPTNLIPDYYTETLFREFKSFIGEMDDGQHCIGAFITRHLGSIRERFARSERSEQRAYPEHYAFDEGNTIRLIARWEATGDFLERLMTVPETDPLKTILEKLNPDYRNLSETEPMETDNGINLTMEAKSLSMRQQTIILCYLLDKIGGRNINYSDRARFIKKLTRMSLDNIYDVVRNPLEYNSYNSFKKDMTIVWNELNMLGLNELAEKVLKDMREN